jgi:hypothetical protein
VLGTRGGDLQGVIRPQVVEVPGDLFAKDEVNAAGMVDEKAQHLVSRLLQRDQLDRGIELR